MFKRSLHLPAAGEETFFLWGPRQTGKTTLLKAAYPDAFWIERKSRRTEDGILILDPSEFCARLQAGDLF
jgi:hypothetical protein